MTKAAAATKPATETTTPTTKSHLTKAAATKDTFGEGGMAEFPAKHCNHSNNGNKATRTTPKMKSTVQTTAATTATTATTAATAIISKTTTTTPTANHSET